MVKMFSILSRLSGQMSGRRYMAGNQKATHIILEKNFSKE